MWMQYSEQHWPEVENLNQAVERLWYELDKLSFDVEHHSIYEDSYADEETNTYYMKLSEKYKLGAALCQRYLHRMLDLVDFCHVMVDAKLKSFLVKIRPYMPENIIAMFNLNETSDYDSEVEIDSDRDV